MACDWCLASFLEKLRADRELELLGKCVGLSEDKRAEILSDFRAGCGAYATEFDLKLNMWPTSNPYVLFGVGWHKENAAKICASKSLQLWLQSTNQGLEHPRTMFFFGNAILYSQLSEFGIE